MSRGFISVKADVSVATRRLSDIELQQMPFARALALTRTAQLVKLRLIEEMDTAFDRPTPYTKNSLFVKPATKADPNATVKVKDEQVKGAPPVNWLRPEIEGGGRNVKGFELLLQRAGILPSGWYAIPAQGADLDGYGNVSRGTYSKILAQLQAMRDPLSNESAAQRRKRNLRRQAGRYFAVIPGRPPTDRLPPGIYERMGTSRAARALPIFIFTSKAPKYRKRYRFFDVGVETARLEFPAEFEVAMNKAIASAK